MSQIVFVSQEHVRILATENEMLILEDQGLIPRRDDSLRYDVIPKSHRAPLSVTWLQTLDTGFSALG
jgi:hypothetical protein